MRSLEIERKKQKQTESQNIKEQAAQHGMHLPQPLQSTSVN